MKIIDLNLCTKCGALLDIDEKECPICGKKVNENKRDSELKTQIQIISEPKLLIEEE